MRKNNNNSNNNNGVCACVLVRITKSLQKSQQVYTANYKFAKLTKSLVQGFNLEEDALFWMWGMLRL